MAYRRTRRSRRFRRRWLRRIRPLVVGRRY